MLEGRINFGEISILPRLGFVYTFVLLRDKSPHAIGRYAAVQRSYRINESDECACCSIDSPFAVTFLDIGQQSASGNGWRRGKRRATRPNAREKQRASCSLSRKASPCLSSN